MKKLADARNGKAAREPYRGDTPPPEYPDAVRAKDGSWYVKRDGTWNRVAE